MKDEKLFLETNFTFENLISIKNKLIKNGWIIKSYCNKVTIFESKDDEVWDEMMCENEGNSYEESLLMCLIEIKNYYKRVTT
jgi:hypothetical protein